MNSESQPAISEINAQRLRAIAEAKARAVGAFAAEPLLEKAPEPVDLNEPLGPSLDTTEQPEASEDQQ